MASIDLTKPVFNKRFPSQEYFQIKEFYLNLKDLKLDRETLYHSWKIQNIIDDIQKDTNNFWNYWKYFYIPKKDGSQRIIYYPNKNLQHFFKYYLKLVQKIDEIEDYFIEHKIINKDFRNLYDTLPIQKPLKDSFLLSNSYDIISYSSKKQNSYGFEKGKNITMNAMQHKDSQYLLKMDIHAAFPSIKKQSIFKILYFYERKLESLLILLNTFIYHQSIKNFIRKLKSIQYSKRIKKQALSLCNDVSDIITFNNCLVTGASMSPWILNKYLYSFDKSVHKYCKKRNLKYTRYADDLTISGHDKISKGTQLFIKNMLKNWGMNENTKKTCFQSYKRKNIITGIVVSYDDKTKKGSLGIGYKRFNELKKNLYLMKQKKLTIEEENKTLGMLNFLRSVNIDRYNYLVEKYELV